MNSPLCSSIINNKGDICDLSPVQAAAAELNQGGEAVLSVRKLENADAEGLAAGGVGPVGRHDQVVRRPITWS